MRLNQNISFRMIPNDHVLELVDSGDQGTAGADGGGRGMHGD